MKQVSLTRLINKRLKAQAKVKGWKSVGGFAYWRAGDLFFNLGVHTSAQQHTLHYLLLFKWFNLDNLLWRILGLSSNEAGPLSLHANGAFTIAGQEILSNSITNCEWTVARIDDELIAIVSMAQDKSAQVTRDIRNIDEYLVFIEHAHVALMVRHPGARTNLWNERLLVAIEKGDRVSAATIARARIAARDIGGFMTRRQTFYENALDYLTR